MSHGVTHTTLTPPSSGSNMRGVNGHRPGPDPLLLFLISVVSGATAALLVTLITGH